MNPKQLIETYPTLYHMATDGSWPNIQRHGLLSTSALLDLFEVNGFDRESIESERRPKCVTIEHPTHGRAVIRDNIPLRESALRKCLEGMTPTQWYELLNRHVFFWPTEERLEQLLRARAYRESAHCVITVSTESLVARYGERIRLNPINSGAALYNPPKRGRTTFLSVERYPFDEWTAKRARKKVVAEVAVLGGVMDIKQIALRVERRKCDRILEVSWEPSQNAP